MTTATDTDTDTDTDTATNTAVKICGIATPDDYDTCRAAGAAFVGMVFFPRSPRHLTMTQARAIADHAEAVGPGPQRVALTVDMDDAGLEDIISYARPQLIQLHGNETPARAAAIRDRFGLPLIRAIRVAAAEDLADCADWNGIADWLLFDAKGDPGGLPGGTGHSFDWTLLANHPGSTRWMLAGGLSSENVSRAVAVTGATAVDVSSGVESAPGKKDAARIREFVSQAQLR
ncbi:MAG: phosphoribosylanthranilate isomerase [Candidatus Puniceispirillaceae bacterium]